jgi:hypothetical protein
MTHLIRVAYPILPKDIKENNILGVFNADILKRRVSTAREIKRKRKAVAIFELGEAENETESLLECNAT